MSSYFCSLYISFYFGLTDDNYSIHAAAYWALLVIFFVLHIWSAASLPTKLNRPQLFSSLGIWGSRVIYSFVPGLDSLSHYRMSLVFWYKLIFFIYFGVFDTLRLRKWRLNVLVLMTFRFWEMIFSNIWVSVLCLYFVC